MTTADLLAAYRQNPTSDLQARLRALLQPVAEEVIAGAGALPDWYSAKNLKDDISQALEAAIKRLVHYTFDESAVTAYVKEELQSVIAPKLERLLGDLANGFRSARIRRGWKRRGQPGQYDAVDDPDGGRPDERTERMSTGLVLAEMFPQANTPKKKTAITLWSRGEKFATIRTETGLRGPDLLRLLLGLRDE